jgi:sialate O-acetylesterase
MKRVLILSAALLAAVSLQAKVELPSIFGDNMVLQQKENVAVWGTATGKKVTISTTWSKQKTVVTPSSDGKWFARIATPQAGGPYEVTISDGEKTVLHNVLIGEVWFCGGQSNMEMPMRGWAGQPVEHSTDYILKAKPSVPIRVIKIPKRNSTRPLPLPEGSWKENTPENVGKASAVAYFFACKLQEILEVPVGIIDCDWGGSSIETWIPQETVAKEFAGEFDLSFLDKDGLDPKDHKSPCVVYNGMVAPLVPFTFRGMLWYQGESNRGRHAQYVRLQDAYVRKMRELFQNPDAPFYFVQIAPYAYSNPRGFKSGYFFEAQQKTLAVIPRSGMAPTVDLGNRTFIHPPKKLEVGNRLAYLALVNDYGLKGINPVAPAYQSVEFKGAEAIITVKADGPGLLPAKVPVGGFEIAGEDRVFHPATATAYKNVVTVTCDEVPNPVAVRYCFRNWGEGTLWNSDGIPLLPFRTDGWDDLGE